MYLLRKIAPSFFFPWDRLWCPRSLQDAMAAGEVCSAVTAMEVGSLSGRGWSVEKTWLGGVFKYLLFSPLPGEMIQFNEHIFQMGGSTTNQMRLWESWDASLRKLSRWLWQWQTCFRLESGGFKEVLYHFQLDVLLRQRYVFFVFVHH